MVIKPPAQATSCFKNVNLEWKRGGHLCSFSWKHETRKLYCVNSLLGLELLLFPKLLSLSFILYSVAASIPKMSLSKQKSWQKCRVFQHNWSVSYFLRRWMGYPEVKVRRNDPERRSGEKIIAGTPFR